MARVVDEEAQRAKRRAILDLAGELVRTKGYERMTIQDVLDGLGISRGALYHYFDSKEALLEALVDRFGQDAAAVLLPMVHDPGLTALEKFHRYADTSARLKADRPELIAGLLRTWYGNDNVLVRQKLTDGTLGYTAPVILEPIIRQGVAEGTFTTRYPRQTARIVAGVLLSLADGLVTLLFLEDPDGGVEERARDLVAAHTEGIERLLGAPPGSLRIDAVDQLVELARLARADGTGGAR
jgi:AcrR family transcriptional regulator